jgi:peptide/nickel transport system substrate-binding protein
MHFGSRRKLTAGVAAAALLFTLLGCAPAAPPTPTPAPEEPTPTPVEPAQVERLRMGIITDESTINPWTYVTGTPGWSLLMLQYDALMHINAEGVPQPWLASAVEVSEDGLTYTITLRDGIRWNDGTPMTADDVVFTVEQFREHPMARFTRALRPVVTATAPAPNQVVFTLAAPDPSLPLATLADVPIIPRHIWEDIENPAEHVFPTPTNVGTGPYKIVEYVPDQFYRLEANPDYFRGLPAVKELVVIVFADDVGAIAALRGGGVDMIARSIAPEQRDPLLATGEIEVIEGPLYVSSKLIWDVTRAPFDRLEVRQAVALAIDRQDLADTVYLGRATPGNVGWTHPDSPAFNPAVVTRTDVAEANAILDGIGAADTDGDGIRELDGEPLSVELLTPSGDGLRLRQAELISEMLREIGLRATVAAVERATWEAKVWPEFDVAKGRDYQLAMFGWSAPVMADPGRIADLVHSDPAIGSINLTGFSHPEADELAAALDVTGDPARRTEIINRLQEIIAEQLPFLTLLYPDGLFAYRPDVYDDWVFITGQGIVDKTSLLPPAARP